MKVAATELLRVESGSETIRPDLLAVEEPLEIRLGYGPADRREQRSLTVTMRTPGDDPELALGLLFCEGLIGSAEDIRHLDFCSESRSSEAVEWECGAVLRLELDPSLVTDFTHLNRHSYTSSSCGVCGKTSLPAVFRQKARFSSPEIQPSVPWSLLSRLPALLREKQIAFSHTGGLHAAALFDLNGQLLILREDVGRHNALDKLIGAALYRKLLPLHQYILLLSGRIGFELVQKAQASGCHFLAAIGAPSSLAVKSAAAAGITLVGFLRKNSANVYCGQHRLVNDYLSCPAPEE